MGAPKQSGHWTGFRAVLCSIDFSDQARLALRYAEVVVLWAKASLTVTYANDPPLIAAAAAALHDRQLAKRSAAELQAFAEDTVAPDSRRSFGSAPTSRSETPPKRSSGRPRPAGQISSWSGRTA